MSSMKEKFKNMDKIVLAIVLMACITVLAVLISAYSSAIETGKNVGKTAGIATGNLVGSYEGTKEGYEAGKSDALNPIINIEKAQEKVRGLGSLEVLVIETEYLDVFKTDQTDNPNYAEIFTEQVKIIFTVDLTKAEIKTIGDNSILVRIPDIQSSYTVIEGTYDSKDSYQKPGIAPGSTTDTITQETKNHNALIKSIGEKVSTDYYDKAVDAAQNQVKSLAKAMTGKDVVVEIAED